MKRFLVLVNPSSHGGRSGRRWRRLAERLPEGEFVVLKSIEEARERAREAKGYETVVACGGDGTVNEVASGIVGFKKKAMAILVFHSNCDFIKYYPGRCFTSVREIIDGEDIQIDIIKIKM